MKTFALAALAMALAATASAQPPAAPAAASSPAASEWKPGEPPPDMTTYYLVMLVKGPKWTPGTSPALEQLQREHLAHLRKLALAGKLVLAGPLTDGGTIRGLGVFKVASIDEARALEAEDPAVKSGRLAVEVHPWLVQKGILP
jgi:uncharacterized protein YciI